MQLGVSVIICCYNSAARLPDTLKHLALQRVPAGILWEVIVIDNASTDNTFQVASQEWEKYTIPNAGFRLLSQPIPGKNHAHKMGIEAANYEYILTCDDDNRLCADYVSIAYESMSADNKIGVLGGCGIFDPQQPAWSDIEKHKQSYVNGPQTWASTAHWVYGAGCVCRKSLFINLYNKDWQQITSGRNGTKLICGEDVEICFIIYICGYKIKSNDRLTFHHFVPLKRQSLKYILNLQYWISYSYVLLNNYLMLMDGDKRSVQKKLNDWSIYNIKALVMFTVKLARQKLIKLQPLSVDEKLKLQSHLGSLISIFNNRKKIIKHHSQLTNMLKNQEMFN
ncbi:glycosyltransferase family A protein [Mucilaginibacter sp.]|uniref:glycosyltransferase n=1 Tax=Mucilaginibacter sp. TaxID=1882438 RepID=UPI0025D0ACD8|nr:glycosyltransferase family A protein [Mucilaginibacter sp.]